MGLRKTHRTKLRQWRDRQIEAVGKSRLIQWSKPRKRLIGIIAACVLVVVGVMILTLGRGTGGAAVCDEFGDLDGVDFTPTSSTAPLSTGTQPPGVVDPPKTMRPAISEFGHDIRDNDDVVAHAQATGPALLDGDPAVSTSLRTAEYNTSPSDSGSVTHIQVSGSGQAVWLTGAIEEVSN